MLAITIRIILQPTKHETQADNTCPLTINMRWRFWMAQSLQPVCQYLDSMHAKSRRALLFPDGAGYHRIWKCGLMVFLLSLALSGALQPRAMKRSAVSLIYWRHPGQRYGEYQLLNIPTRHCNVLSISS